MWTYLALLALAVGFVGVWLGVAVLAILAWDAVCAAWQRRHRS